MDPVDRLIQLSAAMEFEPDGERSDPLPPLRDSSGSRVGPTPSAAPGGLSGCGFGTVEPAAACAPKMSGLPISHAVMPGGKTIKLLKTLQTSACENDCYYCCFRARRDFRRTTFTPDEMAQAFMNLYRAGEVEGLFLSSGVAGGGVRTQDKILATAEILRRKRGFRGYIHLKIMPGAERAQVEQAMRLADRVSINLEAPNTNRLARLAPHKVFMEELLRPLEWVEQVRRTQPAHQVWNRRWPSTTTQFVVGGAGESDLELLGTTAFLNRQVHLARAYYSRFKPVRDTPLENLPAENPWREHRLYQASFLLRDYGFDVEELPFEGAGNLPLGVDPKLEWARQHLSEQPVEINRADRHELLRIPGIGPKSAGTILAARTKGRLRTLGDLRAAGVLVNRAAPFLLLDGCAAPRQLPLF